jgi:hypothetical protein
MPEALVIVETGKPDRLVSCSSRGARNVRASATPPARDHRADGDDSEIDENFALLSVGRETRMGQLQ